MKLLCAGCCAVMLAAVMHQAAAAGPCGALASLQPAGSTITLAEIVESGELALPAPAGAQQNTLRGLPAFCRVAATLQPTHDSDIRIELWMPVSHWNGKFQAVGNGGWSGAIAYAAMAEALRRGYATSSTDTGHSGSTAAFALGHPEKLTDFAYRAVHEMTVVSKTLIAGYYATSPSFSYWRGCSAGGRQGLKEAQQFPGDFDGIIAGAPAGDWTGRAAQSMRIAHVVHKTDASYIPPAKYPLIHDAVLRACDALDGVKDGVLENPRACRFDPDVLQCKGTDDGACLTRAQSESAREFYRSPANPKTARAITGLEPGSELGWSTWGGAQPFAIGQDFFRYVVFKDPSWDSRRFSFDTDIVLAESAGGAINALETNLKPFFDRGGKLLQYHGWNDPQISPGNSVQYYDRTVEALGGASRISDSYRLFMVPGMAHCSGGDGPNTFDVVAAIEQWVEHGIAPARIDASRVRDGKVDRTRPLCPYPQIATYSGSGSTDAAANFVCK